MGQRKQRAAKAYRRALKRLATDIDEALHAAVAGTDPEGLHKLRVAVRRTRVVLANAKHIIGEPDRQRFRAGFGQLAAATSELRDLDVAVSSWTRLADTLDPSDAEAVVPLLAALAHRRRRAHETLVCELRSPAFRALLDDWHRHLAGPVDLKPRLARARLQRVVSRRRRRAVRRLRRSTATATSPEGRHRARKDAKRLRYLIEAFAGAFKKRWRRREVKRLTKLQDKFGRDRDTLVQLQLLDDLAAEAKDERLGTASAVLRELLQGRVDAP